MIFLIGGAYQGKTAYAKAHFPTYRLITDYQERVKFQLQHDEDPVAALDTFLRNETNRADLVVISCEMGCGVVPLDPFERAWREANGRVNCRLASAADCVIRVTAGIGERIK